MTYSYHSIGLPPENNWLMIYIGAITKTMTGCRGGDRMVVGSTTAYNFMKSVEQELPTLPEHLSSHQYRVRFVLFDLYVCVL